MRFLFFLLFFIISTCKLAFGQDTLAPPEEVFHSLSAHTQLKPAEKAYLHLDKMIYSPGETIWFKAYMTQASTNSPGSFGTLLHVQLLSPFNKLLAKRNIFITDGVGVGDIELSDSLTTGQYQLKAYSQYMLNFDTAFIYSKSIQIIGNKAAEASAGKAKTLTSEKPSTDKGSPPFNLRFFPEGGELIEGLEARVAAKAQGVNGKGIAVKGKIEDSSGNTIGWFETQKFGLGDFVLKPAPGHKGYTAVVKHQGEAFRFPLPESKKSGFSLSIRNRDNKLYILAKHSKQEETEGAFILAHLRGQVFSIIEGKKDAEQIYAALPIESIPSGVAHFTLFNKNGIPQSERLVFIENPREGLSLSVEPNKQSYNTREKATVALSLTDTAGSAVAGRVSVTAVDLSLAQSFKNIENIKSYFLLSSDLKGKIEQPFYYFNPTNKDRKYLLDLLMLTHGWRRFSWKEVLEKPLSPPAILPEQGFTIQGKIYNYYNQKKEMEGAVKLMMLENPLLNQLDTTSEQGTFSFNGLHFADTATFILQANKLRKKAKKGNDNIYIKIDSTESFLAIPLTGSVTKTQDSSIDDSLAKKVQQKNRKIRQIDSAYDPDKRAVMLKEVAVESSRNKENDPFAEAGRLYGEPSTRLVLDSLFTAVGSQNVFNIIQGRVAGLIVAGAGFDKRALIRGGEAFYLLDGIPADAQIINGIPTQNVAYIDILKGAKASIFGSRGTSGVIAIYTKKGRDQEPSDTDVPGIISFKHPGYYLAREFYTPNYEEDDPQHAKPDFRSTLYWNPDIVIDKNGQASLEFFTSDEKGDYILLIEGITFDGRFITGQQPFSVREP